MHFLSSHLGVLGLDLMGDERSFMGYTTFKPFWALGGYTIFLSVFALLGVTGACGLHSSVRER